MINKKKSEVTNLLQNISNALNDRYGREDLFAENSNYIDGVKEAIPKMEKALQALKDYLKYDEIVEEKSGRKMSEYVYVPIKKELLERIQDLSESTNVEIYESQPYEHFVNNILVTEKLRLEKIQKTIEERGNKA